MIEELIGVLKAFSVVSFIVGGVAGLFMIISHFYFSGNDTANKNLTKLFFSSMVFGIVMIVVGRLMLL